LGVPWLGLLNPDFTMGLVPFIHVRLAMYEVTLDQESPWKEERWPARKADNLTANYWSNLVIFK
jgi:hypothetical protein